MRSCDMQMNKWKKFDGIMQMYLKIKLKQVLQTPNVPVDNKSVR